ncbi:MAG: fibronectin type III domain-containing protein [Thermoplasmata archaeon]|nr:MAG: fibronectin type III domain-containing protein [Thermoplasmata archaeon]
MIVKVGRTQKTNLLVILISTILISMTFFTFIISTENEGLPVGGEFRVNEYTTTGQFLPSTAMNSTGSFVVTWHGAGAGDVKGIYARLYERNGSPIGTDFQVNTYTTDTQWMSSVAMNVSGNFVIAWESSGQDGNGWGVYAQRFDRDGNPEGTEFRVNTRIPYAQCNPAVSMDSNGNFVITWESYDQDTDGYGIYAQRYDNNGNPLGGEFRVNSYITKDQRESSVAMSSTGSFVVTWSSYGQDGSNWGVYAKRYKSNGNPEGAEFLVNTHTEDVQCRPSVAMDPEGDFVIAWDSNGQDGGGYGVYAQRYDRNGNPMGPEFQVNTYISNYQRRPSVAMDSGGNFVITWESYGQDGSNYGIYAQQYDSVGNPLGNEFKVNTYTADVQDFPSIGMDEDGNFVISWESKDQDGSSYGIYAQRYNNIIPFKISDIQVLDITDSDATITWKTSKPANSTIECGLSTTYDLTTGNNSKLIFHRMDLTGLEPGRLYHFRVSSYNNSGNYSISSDFTFTTKYRIDLEPGWNMISLPLNQTDSHLGKVLVNISGDYDAVQCFDITDPIDPWKHNHISKPSSLNDLTDIDKHLGLWIHITNPLGTTLYVHGTAPDIGYINKITLHNGWNLVGYPSLIERPPDSSGLPAEVDMVMWYNASSGLWESWDPGSYSSDNLNLLRPGQGLWVHYTGTTDVWSLEYVN